MQGLNKKYVWVRGLRGRSRSRQVEMDADGEVVLLYIVHRLGGKEKKKKLCRYFTKTGEFSVLVVVLRLPGAGRGAGSRRRRRQEKREGLSRTDSLVPLDSISDGL